MAAINKDSRPPPGPPQTDITTNPPPLYRRISRPQNLHLEIINPSQPSIFQPLKHNSINNNNHSTIDGAITACGSHVNICSNSSAHSDSSSRSSTPTRSPASSTTTDDGSSIATPTLESSSSSLKSSSPFGFSTGVSSPSVSAAAADSDTRLLLRDRYLDSLQRPIILGTTTITPAITPGSTRSRGNSLDIPQPVYQDAKLAYTAPAITPPLLPLPEVFTPPETPASASKGFKDSTAAAASALKSVPPPTFHLGPRQKRDLATELLPADWADMGIDNRVLREEREGGNEINGILQPIGEYELDDAKKPTKLGSGAWSNVYKGVLYHKNSAKAPFQQVIAVKRPLNTFSIPALKREAAILSHIHRKVSSSSSSSGDRNVRSSESYSVIPFHGFDASTTSILMTALSGDNLEQFTTRCRSSISRDVSNFNALKLPVVGITQWLFIAERLISAFAFLKSAGVIHGDVKPQNILTKPADPKLLLPLHEGRGAGRYSWISKEEIGGLVEPVVADFSSSYVVDTAGNISDEEEAINAVTTIYCAPELLAAFLTPPTTPTNPTPSSASVPPKSEPRPLPTFSSDQYGLCMTLLQTAIGSHPYSAAKMDIQKNMWVRQGDPMAFARADERGFRCKNGGAVDRLLRGCFGKTAVGRVGIEEMVGRVAGLCMEWEGRKGEDAWVWGGRL
ncbi:hypothetical protein TWF730_004272 [Orbilia blumenaviensis]|uniref:Protein kinase domain-containing protein n=1 Tax=Orbilia blumenaviensis TaxID=1796055 RepID=A0AAV9U3U5_9PEZI